MKPVIYVIIPAYNEESSIGKVIPEIPADVIDEVVVVDNGSTDGTSSAARNAGATVVLEPQRGYGSACLAGIEYCRRQNPLPDIVVFLDGDFSDFPDETRILVKPIIDKKADLVIGSRTLGKRERGSMTAQQIFGNWLATNLLRLFFKAKFTDLGPFRAIRFPTLLDLNMKDRSYGWTVEMQVKTAKQNISFTEVPVGYRKRIGVSKISGTLKGTMMAGFKILYTIFRYI